ncbi:uracil-DNA glycosylase [Auriculariales sp. MPI-PUGE-AT-0066]|nr:uracil-DNA glycosylase [Auriculariales sp. MPI-PUGE-AT-0066]
MGDDWRDALKAEFEKPYFRALKTFLNQQKGKKVFPPMKDIYSWSRLTPLKEVKVVIIGQVFAVTGLAFSVLNPVKPPPSLRNIYKQLACDIPGFTVPKTNGDLSATAKQGVLWLNTALTVEAHNANSHSKAGWVNLTKAALHAVAAREGDGVVILAWGAHAQKMCDGIDAERNLILKSAHPSPLSANRGFLGNEHFKKANEWLKETHGSDGGVDWTVLK